MPCLITSLGKGQQLLVEKLMRKKHYLTNDVYCLNPKVDLTLELESINGVNQ